MTRRAGPSSERAAIHVRGGAAGRRPWRQGSWTGADDDVVVASDVVVVASEVVVVASVVLGAGSGASVVVGVVPSSVIKDSEVLNGWVSSEPDEGMAVYA